MAGTAFVLLGAGLAACVIGLIRDNRNDILASAPIVREQEVRLARAGEVVVMVETPRTATDYRAFQIQLVDQQNGQSVTLAYSLMTAKGAVYGVTTMQVPFGRMNAHPGTYFVRMAGLREGKDYSECRLILSRPYMGRMAAQIIGIVLCGVGMLLSIICAAWMAGLLTPAQN